MSKLITFVFMRATVILPRKMPSSGSILTPFVG